MICVHCCCPEGRSLSVVWYFLVLQSNFCCPHLLFVLLFCDTNVRDISMRSSAYFFSLLFEYISFLSYLYVKQIYRGLTFHYYRGVIDVLVKWSGPYGLRMISLRATRILCFPWVNIGVTQPCIIKCPQSRLFWWTRKGKTRSICGSRRSLKGVDNLYKLCTVYQFLLKK